MRFVRRPSEDTPRGHTKDAIERMILSRGYKVGDKLPTYRDLAAHFGIAVRTIERVMRRMAEEGTIQLLHGKGAFIRKLPAGHGQLAEIGLVYPASRIHLIETPYLNQILLGVIWACDMGQIDLQIVALRAAGNPAAVPVPPRDVALRVDGVILLGFLNKEYLAGFAGETVPVVLVDAQAPEAGIHSISVDNAAAVQQVMDHLYSLGHRRIAYVDAQAQDDLAGKDQPRWMESPDTYERREAYLANVRRLGLEYQRIFPIPKEDLQVLDTFAADLRGDPNRPSAILVYDDTTVPRFHQALSKVGLRVPDDISVAVAVAARRTTPTGTPLVTCAIADFPTMGSAAVETLQRQAAGRQPAGPCVQRIAVTLQVGASTAAPRGQ